MSAYSKIGRVTAPGFRLSRLHDRHSQSPGEFSYRNCPIVFLNNILQRRQFHAPLRLID
jgi:hypothetical protein